MISRWSFAFDLDGTLIDNQQMFFQTATALRERYQLPHSTETIQNQLVREYFRRNDSDKSHFVVEDHEYPYMMFAQEIDHLYHDFAVPAEGVLEFLSILKDAGCTMVVITNGSENGQRRKFESAGLAKWIPNFLSSEKAGVNKPNPQIFQIAAELFHFSLSESFYFGDHPINDMQGAKGAGMITVNVGCHSGVSSDYHISSFRDDFALREILHFAKIL